MKMVPECHIGMIRWRSWLSTTSAPWSAMLRISMCHQYDVTEKGNRGALQTNLPRQVRHWHQAACMSVCFLCQREHQVLFVRLHVLHGLSHLIQLCLEALQLSLQGTKSTSDMQQDFAAANNQAICLQYAKQCRGLAPTLQPTFLFSR